MLRNVYVVALGYIVTHPLNFLYSTILLYSTDIQFSMYIEIHVDGVDTPLCVPISSAGGVSAKLEKEGKSFRLGKTV